jgi:site-specific recombinase XerC
MMISRWLLSRRMTEQDDSSRDLARLVVPAAGSLVSTGDPWEPYRLLDADGVVMDPVTSYFRDLQAAGRSTATLRSYGMDLLRWFRFTWAVDVPWSQATRAEARDFSCWIQATEKRRPESRSAGGSASPGSPNPVTGKPSPGRAYAAATVAHSETVLRGFYELHRDLGSGPMVNPFPLARRRGSRPHAHHNPMDTFRNERSGLYRPKIPKRIPRNIPDGLFNELFARLGSHRDRALVAFWVSTGARAAELLGATHEDADPGQQLITVIRKGSRAMQRLPASPDAFVWLRLYQSEMGGKVPAGRDQPLWWTIRRPFRPLNYHAARAMFVRAGALLGANWSLHDLRHTAAYRMARDPAMPLTDVQAVLGHAQLSTTQIYTTPTSEDVIASVLAHHARRADGRVPAADAPQDAAKLRYRPESLEVLFGRPGS